MPKTLQRVRNMLMHYDQINRVLLMYKLVTVTDIQDLKNHMKNKSSLIIRWQGCVKLGVWIKLRSYQMGNHFMF